MPARDWARHAPTRWSPREAVPVRLLSAGGLYAWELEKAGRELRVRVEGQLAFDSTGMIVRAAAAGFGLGFVMEDQAAQQPAGGRLIRVLEDSCPRFAGYHLYYPSRREPSAAFALLVEALGYRASRGAAQQWPPTLQSNAL
jgi:DNA-binding transcriptional LysR family regulator